VIDLLSQILCWIQQLGALVLRAIILGINAVIAAVAGFVQSLIDADPISFPDIPEWPDSMETAYSWVAWVFPVPTLFNVLAFVVAAWLAWQLVALGLRWAKLTGE